jgi:endonuclease YncB( thermonuclease family)
MPTRRTVLAAVGGAFAGGTTIGWLGRGWRSSDERTTASCDCPAPETDQQYDVVLLEVIDGDTVDLLADLGLNTRRKIRVRITDLDTAEIHGVPEGSDEYRLGIEQKRFVEERLTDAETLVYRSEEDRRPFGERFPDEHDSPQNGKGGLGRWLGDINMDGRWLSEAVLERWPDAVYEE